MEMVTHNHPPVKNRNKNARPVFAFHIFVCRSRGGAFFPPQRKSDDQLLSDFASDGVHPLTYD